MTFLGTFAAFVLEQTIVSSPDILIAGLGSYWIVRQRKMMTWGAGLLALYVVAVIGMAMGPDGPGLGFVFGCIAAVGGAALAIYQNKKGGSPT